MKTTYLKSVLFMAIMFLFASQLNAANNYEVRGKIVKSDKKAVCSATVILLDAKTMQIIAETTCQGNGEFVFENVENGDYVISVSKAGYKKSTNRHIAITDNGKISENNFIAINK